MAEAGLQEVETSIAFHHNIVTQYIAIIPIMYLCLEVDRLPGTRVSKQWWEQEGLDLEGVRMVAHEA